MSETIQQTKQAALRLLRSKIRTYLYEDGGNSPMLQVQATWSRMAEREWTRVLGLWDLQNEDNLRQIAALLQAALPEAEESVLSTFQDPWPQRNKLRKYREGFDPLAIVRGTV